MAKSFPDVKVLSPEYSKSVVATASSQVDALMLAHGDLAGVFGVNGNSATGAAKAIGTAGKAGEIHVAGYDAEPATVKLLEEGSIEILVVQDFATEGKLAVQYAYAALEGNDDDIVRNTELENVIATTENASDPEVSKYFYKEDC
jgi:ribose transport system substrate-binding protein